MALQFHAKKLAKDILEKRTKDDLTFRKIESATRGKINRTTLQRIEAAGQIPSAETLADICNWLDKSVTEYIY